MINKKYLIVFLILIFSTSCSFDNKTGIWGEGIDEKRRISQLEKEQKKIIDIDKIYSSENLYEKELNLSTNVSLSKPKKNNSWEMIGLNHQNLLGNISLPSANNIFLKKKIGKNKFTITGNRTPILMFKNNIFFSDDTGTIFYIDNYGNLIWKKNIYKKIYKKINKNLVLSTYENKLFVADNIGFLYSIKINTGEIIWIKNHGVSIKSNIKIFNNKAFLIDQDNRIFAFRTSDGSKIWNILSISSFIKSQNLLSLAITEQSDLIALSSAGDLYRININTGEVYWTSNRYRMWPITAI